MQETDKFNSNMIIENNIGVSHTCNPFVDALEIFFIDYIIISMIYIYIYIIMYICIQYKK